MTENNENNGKAWLKKHTAPHKGAIFLLCVVSVFATGCSVAFAYLTKYLVNFASSGESKRTLITAAILFGIVIFKIVSQAFVRFYSEKTRARINVDLRTRLYERVLRADYSEITEYHSGEMMARITQDSAEIASSTVGIAPAAFSMAMQLVGSIAALFALDYLFTVILLVGGGITAAITVFCKKKLKTYQKEIMAADAKNRAVMQEGISSVIAIKAYEAEEKTVKNAEKSLNEYLTKRVSRAAFNTGVSSVYSLITGAGMLFAIVWCAVKALNGVSDYGMVLSVVLLTEQLQRPFSSFSSIMISHYSQLASAERLCEIDSLKQEKIERTTTDSDFDCLKVENLSFSYGGDLVLDNFNFTVNKGEIALIEGESGTGKTTFFKLLLGICKPKSGSIVIEKNGKETIVDESTRGLFAYVPQGNFLFSGTVAENVAFFADKSKNEETVVKRAINIACADFVYDLPDGLNTVLGERGIGISEGQIQRLAVARAIASGRPILLLDEATASLDEETQNKMLENIRKQKDLTCIMISHRSAAKEYADITQKVINKV